MESIIVYMDDLLIIGVESYEKYIEQVDELLTRLKSKQMQVNPDKSFWAKTEITYLGFLMNQQGIKSQPENVKAMLDSKPPKNKKYLRQFIGMVNYYKDLFNENNWHIETTYRYLRQEFNFHMGRKSKQGFHRSKSNDY